VYIREDIQRVNSQCFNNKRLKRRATCDVARVARRLLRTISRHYRKFLCFWFMQQCTLSYVISALAVFPVGERLLALRMPYSTFRWIFMKF